MSSYILKVQPMLDESKAKRIESSLVKRFGSVAKKFGRGIKNALKFGITGGGIATVLSAILQPLKEADEKLNAILAKADNVGTRAQQFGTNAADYLAFQESAGSKGISEDELVNILGRMQTLIGEAKLGKDNVLSNFKDETDMIKVFVNLTKALNGLDNETRAKYESTIFGRRAVGKLEDFITSDIEALGREITGRMSKERANRELARLGMVEDEQSILRSRRDFEDTFDAAKNITYSTVQAQDKNERNKNERANQKMSNYEMYAKIQDTVDKLLLAVTNITTPLLQVISPLVDLIAWGASYLPPLAKQLKDFMETVPAKLDNLKNSRVGKWLGF